MKSGSVDAPAAAVRLHSYDQPGSSCFESVGSTTKPLTPCLRALEKTTGVVEREEGRGIRQVLKERNDRRNRVAQAHMLYLPVAATAKTAA